MTQFYFVFQVKGLDICLMAKDFKTKPKSCRADLLFYKKEHYSTLVEIMQVLGIATTSNPRQLNLANQITKFVENSCPDSCLFEIEEN